MLSRRVGARLPPQWCLCLLLLTQQGLAGGEPQDLQSNRGAAATATGAEIEDDAHKYEVVSTPNLLGLECLAQAGCGLPLGDLLRVLPELLDRPDLSAYLAQQVPPQQQAVGAQHAGEGLWLRSDGLVDEALTTALTVVLAVGMVLVAHAWWRRWDANEYAAEIAAGLLAQSLSPPLPAAVASAAPAARPAAAPAARVACPPRRHLPPQQQPSTAAAAHVPSNSSSSSLAIPAPSMPVAATRPQQQTPSQQQPPMRLDLVLSNDADLLPGLLQFRQTKLSTWRALSDVPSDVSLDSRLIAGSGYSPQGGSVCRVGSVASTSSSMSGVEAQIAADYLFGNVGQHWVLDPQEVDIVKRVGGGSWGEVHLGSYHDTMVAVKSFRRRPMCARGSSAQQQQQAFIEGHHHQQAEAGGSGGDSPGCGGGGGDREIGGSASPRPPHQLDSSAMSASPLPLELRIARQELSVLAQLRHPNLVTFMGITLDPPCLLMEFCHQGSLWHVLHKARGDPGLLARLDWPRRLAMAIDAAKAMQYLHGRPCPVLHRDLRSPNLLVTKHWSIKVADLGMSRTLARNGADPGGGGSGDVGYSPAAHLTFMNPKWCAPEVIQQAPFRLSSDVYSFGIVLWELLTLEEPFGPMAPKQVACAVVNDAERPAIPDDLSTLPGGTFPLAGEYVDTLRWCWHQDPDQRPSFRAVHRRLRAMRRQLGARLYPAQHHRSGGVTGGGGPAAGRGGVAAADAKVGGRGGGALMCPPINE